MKKNLKFPIMLSFLVLVFTLTVVNLVADLSHKCMQQQEPTFWCESRAWKECKLRCGGHPEDCAEAIWGGNYCDYGICYEGWYLQCSDGPFYYFDCSNWLVCPK